MLNNNYIPIDFNDRNNQISLILEDILDSPYSQNIVFKGGTMMSFFLESNRFSEDLDFSLINTDIWIELATWLYHYLRNKWYDLWELHLDRTNVYHMEVYYFVNWNKYACQVELFKYNYNVKIKYYQDFFLWKPINVMNVDQSFSHKCCAYFERWNKKIEMSWKPKGRDLFDIYHYIKMGSKLDLNIIKTRLWFNNEIQLFSEIYKKINITHYKKIKDFAYEIENFSYKKINWVEFINELLEIVNNRYLWGRMIYNKNIMDELDNIDDLNKVIIDDDLMIKKRLEYYEIYDLNTFQCIYNTKDKQKMRKKVLNILDEKYFQI